MSVANDITAALLIEIPKRFPGCRVWRANRIDAMALGSGGRLRRVKAGVDGQADISGIGGKFLPGHPLPIGVRIEIEVKSGKDVVSKSQIAFGNMINGLGGIYIVARDVEGCLEELRGSL